MNKYKDYRNDYNKEHYKSISLRLDKVKDRDVIEWLLSKDNIKQYLVELINKDIEEVIGNGN